MTKTIKGTAIASLMALITIFTVFAAAEPSNANGGVDIVILGGENAVSASVEAELRTCTIGTVTRQSGSNRYATASEISKAAFASSSHAFVATGANFPDALAGGPPAAIGTEPLLLVGATAPIHTTNELQRLGVTSITALGGPAVVSNSVITQLQTIAPTTRIAGSDRYSTAAAIVQGTFPTADTVYIATGLNFPDALAGVPAAAHDNAPILLVQPDSIPVATSEQLSRLAPNTIKILGGTAVISPGVETSLGGYAPSVIRLAGSNRYSTASAISAHAFPGGAAKIYIATGENFPDALAGGPAAGANDAPILLVRTDSIPGSTETEIERLTGHACGSIVPPPPIVASGSGVGDDVALFSLPNEPVVIELTHIGSSNFFVWSLDGALNNVDLLVNEIGAYGGTRAMQFDPSEPVAALEINADGSWTYKIWKLADEPKQTCPVLGSGDHVLRLNEFTSNGTADLTHDGSSNFYIWAWDGSVRDLLVNEIGAYAGTVLVSAGHNDWEISADGNWSVSC